VSNSAQNIVDMLNSPTANERAAAQNMLAEAAASGWYVVNGQWSELTPTTQDLSTKSVTIDSNAYNNLVNQKSGQPVSQMPTTPAATSGNSWVTGNESQDMAAMGYGSYPGISYPAPSGTFSGGSAGVSSLPSNPLPSNPLTPATGQDPLYQMQYPQEMYRQHFGLPLLGLNPYEAWLMKNAQMASMAFGLASQYNALGVPGYGSYPGDFGQFLSMGYGSPSQTRNLLGNMWSALPGMGGDIRSQIFGEPGFLHSVYGASGIPNAVANWGSAAMLGQYAPAVAGYYGDAMKALYPYYASQATQGSGDFAAYLMQAAPKVMDMANIF